MGGQHPPPLWKFLTFTQNWDLHGGTAFSHAWSLCIEEQFYLVLPLVVAGGLWQVGHSRRAWIVLGGLILMGITARTLLWFPYGNDFSAYHTHIYYSTIGRFDEFLPGIAVAMLKNFHRPCWDRLMAQGQRLLLIGCIAVAVVLSAEYRFDEGQSLLITAVGYSSIAIAFAVLVIAALSPRSWLHRTQIQARTIWPRVPIQSICLIRPSTILHCGSFRHGSRQACSRHSSLRWYVLRWEP